MGTIQIKASDEMRLMVFAAQNIVEKVTLPGAPGSVRLWLKNGYGIDLNTADNGTVMLSTIRRQLNEQFREITTTPATPTGTAQLLDVDTAEILRVLTVLKTLPLFMRRDLRLNTMGQIMTWAHRSGNYFFTGDNTRHTAQTQGRTAYNSFGPAGAFFVTGEIIRAGERRKYTVRRCWFGTKFDPINNGPVPALNIDNASGFQEYHNPKMAAINASKRAQEARDRYSFLPDEQVRSPFPPR